MRFSIIDSEPSQLSISHLQETFSLVAPPASINAGLSVQIQNENFLLQNITEITPKILENEKGKRAIEVSIARAISGICERAEAAKRRSEGKIIQVVEEKMGEMMKMLERGLERDFNGQEDEGFAGKDTEDHFPSRTANTKETLEKHNQADPSKSRERTRQSSEILAVIPPNPRPHDAIDHQTQFLDNSLLMMAETPLAMREGSSNELMEEGNCVRRSSRKRSRPENPDFQVSWRQLGGLALT